MVKGTIFLQESKSHCTINYYCYTPVSRYLKENLSPETIGSSGTDLELWDVGEYRNLSLYKFRDLG